MHEKSDILQAVYSAIDDLNIELAPRQRLTKSPQSQLFGRGGSLDSLGLVNLIVTVETKVADHFGAAITLADEKAVSQKNSPFQTVQSLVDYIDELLTETAHA